jgi:hypothetical protein
MILAMSALISSFLMAIHRRRFDALTASPQILPPISDSRWRESGMADLPVSKFYETRLKMDQWVDFPN